MSSSRKSSIKELSKEAGRETDDTLVTLWDAGFSEISDPEDRLKGSKLNLARKVLNIPTNKKIKSSLYWQDYLGVDSEELRSLLSEFNINMSEQQRKLPKGAIKKLKGWIKSSPKKFTPPIVSKQISPSVVPLADGFELKQIGQIRKVKTLKLDEVLKVHEALILDSYNMNDPIEPAGPRDKNIIASAVFRQETSIGNNPKYATVEMVAAALLHSLVHDHPFHNGNKRTALVGMLVLLDENDLMITCSENELFKFILQLAQHKIINSNLSNLSDREVMAISQWILNNSRPILLGERPLSFRKLRQILNKYQCQFEHSTSGATMKITRDIRTGSFVRPKTVTLTTTCHCGGEGREVPKPIINKIRGDLQLDDEHGIDSATFYMDSPCSVDYFIINYRKTLDRLRRL